MSITRGGTLGQLYTIGRTSGGYAYPYVVHQGPGMKIFQPGTQGGIITNAYPRDTTVGTTSIHRFTDNSDTNNYKFMVRASDQTSYSVFGLVQSNRLVLATETRALDTSYSFYGAKPLDIGIVTRTGTSSTFTINSKTYRAAGWKINQVVGTNTKVLDRAELWVFIQSIQGVYYDNLFEAIRWPSVKTDGSYNVQSVMLLKNFTVGNKAAGLYTATLMTPGSVAWIGMPIVELKNLTGSRIFEMQYMLCLKNAT